MEYASLGSAGCSVGSFKLLDIDAFKLSASI